jgi:hypothetical protein
MAQVPNYVPTNGLVAWYPFTGNANDESGNGNNGTVNGATLTTDRFGNANKAYSFDGVDDYISATLGSLYKVTFSFWYNIVYPVNFYPTFIYIDGIQFCIMGGNNPSYIQNNNVGHLGSYSSLKPTPTLNSLPSCIPAFNTWHHVVIVYDNLFNNYAMYIDGKNCGNAGTAINPLSITFGNATFGNTPSGKISDGNAGVKGTLDDIGIWNRALRESEITALYNARSHYITTTITPQNNQENVGNASTFTAKTSASSPNYTWQSDSAQSYQPLNNSVKINGKFKVVRAKERNPSNNQPVTIDVYDKSFSLKGGDNIIITRTDEVKIPGEEKIIKSEVTIGKAKITEDFNKPLYTAKLIANTGFKMKDYKDGDEYYNAVKGEANKTIIATPKIMVIPKKINPLKYVNGEYLLTKEEKMLIAALKNKFEDNKFTTYGFESNLKTIMENRQFNINVQDDIKSKILESSGMDFFVEYENLDQNNTKCDKVFDFKIRSYSTGEDIASDLQNLNSCGTSDEYKNFASAILNSGAVLKINTQFTSLINNGRKISLIFTISNTSQANFNKEFNGIKLKDHIENCLQGIAYNGNLDIEGVVDLRMETTINIPVINENSGKSYTTNTFSEDVLSYIKKNAGIECESSVSKQIVNIKIK